MPELPEVETVCRQMRRLLKGHKIADVQVSADSIVFKGVSADHVNHSLKGNTVREVGRKGKYFWLQFEDDGCLLGHLGMSGWVQEIGKDAEPPRFWKLIMRREDGVGIAITDARRLGRLWLAEDPSKDKAIKKLGPDALLELPKSADFAKLIGKRKAPIKGVLLDQGVLSGIGNYLADEVLYHAKIAPQRPANELSNVEYKRLHGAIEHIVKTAVDAGADENKFPKDWLFHHRWGGNRGPDTIGAHSIVRETVAGRTTAWVPKVQK